MAHIHMKTTKENEIIIFKTKDDHKKTTSTIKVKFDFRKEGELFFKGNIKKHTQDGYVTTYEGLFRYDQELGKPILVDGTKTLPDGTTEIISD